MIGASLLAAGWWARFDVPVDPDPDQAREWLANELAKPEYHERGVNIWEMLRQWFEDRLNEFGSQLSRVPGVAIAVIVVVVLLGILVSVLVVGPIRARRLATRERPIFADETRTAAEIRDSARRLAADGDFAMASIERYRAIVRSLEERVILDEKAGRTAHEVPFDASARLPQLVSELSVASERFDAICYGDARATSADYEAFSLLDDRVQAARPVPTAAESEAVAP